MSTVIKRAYRDVMGGHAAPWRRAKKKYAVQECPQNSSLSETFKVVLDEVEEQNRYILCKLLDRQKTVDRLIRGSLAGSTDNPAIDELEHRIFEAENESRYIVHKLRETERRIQFLTSNSMADENTLMDNLKTRLRDIELRNNAIRKEIYHTEPKLRSLEQYSRKENIEISGIPDTVSNRDLEMTVIKLLGSINVHVTSCDIVTCHRMTSQPWESSGKVIVRFVDSLVSINVLGNSDQLKRSVYKDVFKNDISIVENLSIL